MRRKGLQTGRNLPRGYLQADLDMVHPPGLTPSDKLLAEAELIKVGPATFIRRLLRACHQALDFQCTHAKACFLVPLSSLPSSPPLLTLPNCMLRLNLARPLSC